MVLRWYYIRAVEKRLIKTFARVAELADAQDLKSCGVKPVPVRFRSRA